MNLLVGKSSFDQHYTVVHFRSLTILLSCSTFFEFHMVAGGPIDQISSIVIIKTCEDLKCEVPATKGSAIHVPNSRNVS